MSAKLYPKNLSDDDRRFVLRWRVGFLVFYGVLGLALVGLTVAATSIGDAAKVQAVAKK
jgi:hypothetical protein